MIGRWNVVDAYAEHPDQIDFSPYHYVKDNPIRYDDPDGNCPICAVLVYEAIEGGIAYFAGAAVVTTAVVHNNASNGTSISESDYSHPAAKADYGANSFFMDHMSRQLAKANADNNAASKVHGNSKNSDKPTEHYQYKDQDGKTYDGVGDAQGNRSNQSKKRLEKENPGKTFEKSHSKVHPNRKEALKAEHEGIKKSGGPQGNDPNGANYNKRNSPGAKID